MNKMKKKRQGHPSLRPRTHDGSAQTKLIFAVLRSFLAGVGSAAAVLCLLSVIFANTGLPLNWVGPAACMAAGLGAFVSGLVLGCSVGRLRLLAGAACGVFYCLCAIAASLLAARMPSASEANLSLLAVLMLGALAGGAAGALRKGGSTAGVR